MAIPGNANVVVTWGYWVDEVTGLGVRNAANQPASITFDPVRLDGGSNPTPNLRDLSAQSWIKTRRRTATVNQTSGYFAVVLVSTNDPDLDAYAGRVVTFYNEPPFTVGIPYDAPTVTVDGNMAATTGLALGSTVRGVPMTLLPRLGSEIDFYVPDFYLNAGQVQNKINEAITAHNADPAAHPGLNPGGGGPIGDYVTQSQLDNSIAGHAGSATPHPVYDNLALVTAFETGLV